MCLNIFEVDCSPRIKEKLFGQFYFRTTNQLNLDLCVCERGELYLWPRIKHCVLWKFRHLQCQHEYYAGFFFSIETFRDRKVFTQKEVMVQEKGTTVNVEVIFQHVTGFVYV